MTIRNRLKEFRARYNLEQAELAEAVGCSRVTISRVESGRPPRAELLLRLDHFFGEQVFFADRVPKTVQQFIAKRGDNGAGHPETR